jgi:hypothetical protein
MIAGDIGGVLIPRSKTNADDFADIASLWTGITIDDYKRVAAKTGSPGVVVFAAGGNKASLLRQLLASREQLISYLVIDTELAMVLEKLL